MVQLWNFRYTRTAVARNPCVSWAFLFHMEKLHLVYNVVKIADIELFYCDVYSITMDGCDSIANFMQCNHTPSSYTSLSKLAFWAASYMLLPFWFLLLSLYHNYCDSTTIRLWYDDTTKHSTTTEVIEITICVRFDCDTTTTRVTTTTKNWHVHFLLASNRVEWKQALAIRRSRIV